MITEFIPLDGFCLREDNIKLSLERTAPEDKARGYVPAYYFDIIDIKSGKKAGRCDLRLGYNKRLYYGGNIGYTVFPEFRGDHFAGKACKVLFRLAKKHGMDHVIITCDPNNLPSRRTLKWLDGNLLEIAPLPEWHDMYNAGHRQTCIFRFEL